MEVSDKLIQQRVRNRVIDNFDSFADAQWIYQLGTDEIINMWYDQLDEGEDFKYFTEPVFSIDEVSAMKDFHYHLERLYKEIPSTWKKSDLVSNSSWGFLTDLATKHLNVFLKRGRFSEDEEIT